MLVEVDDEVILALELPGQLLRHHVAQSPFLRLHGVASVHL